MPAESYVAARSRRSKAGRSQRYRLFSKLETRHGANPFCSVTIKTGKSIGVGAVREHGPSDARPRGNCSLITPSHWAPQPLPLVLGDLGGPPRTTTVWNQSPSSLTVSRTGAMPPPPASDDAALSRWIESDEASPWCQVSSLANHKMFRWTRTLNGKRLKAVEALGVGALRALTIWAEASQGRSISRARTRRQTVLGQELRSACARDLRLAVPSIRGAVNALLGSPRSAGWGLGDVCQMGAIGMAEAGYDNASILKHYYPGSSIQTVY